MRSILLAGVISCVLAGALNEQARIWISRHLENQYDVVDGDHAKAEAFLDSIELPWRSTAGMLFWLPFFATFSLVGAVASIAAIRSGHWPRWARVAVTGGIVAQVPLLTNTVGAFGGHILAYLGMWPKMTNTSCFSSRMTMLQELVLIGVSLGGWLIPMVVIARARKRAGLGGVHRARASSPMV